MVFGVVAIFAGLIAAVPASAAPKPKAPAAASAASSGEFSPGTSTSADIAINGYGDSAGYHIEVGRESSGFAWHEVAVLHPDSLDDSSWTGYQCISGDGKYAAVAVLPQSAVNLESARDHGAFAYSVNLASGAVHPVASGVALEYFSPGCGAADEAVFSVSPGTGQESTELVSASLATGKVDQVVTARGQVTSAVPAMSGGIVAAVGSDLVSVSAHGVTSVIARVGGDPFDLRPAADGGVDLLDANAGSATSEVLHERAGAVAVLGSGPLESVQLFGGRQGRAVLSGATATAPGPLAAVGIRVVSDRGLSHGVQAASLDGDALIGPAASQKQTVPVLLATGTGRLVTDSQARASASPYTKVPAFSPPGAGGQAIPDQAGGLRPGPEAAGTPAKSSSSAGKATTTATLTSDVTTAAQSPTCAVPRLDPTKQVMQPSPAQIDWAAQMAEQGLLTTGNGYSRPANFDNLGLVAYAPNSDFSLIPLDHPSSDSWDTVPRSVFEAIMAQESNWSQASWHAPAGVSGDPLIADYYGAAGGIDSIDYADADCGYGTAPGHRRDARR